MPIVPFGMGSSLEGHVNAIHGGVSIDLTRMTRVLRLSPEDLDITVEAGLTRLKLDAHLKNTGLMFPIDPGADATIGGMAATRASGTTAVRYGTMRENVLGLTVVLADGRIIKTGGRARKSSSGYDLTRLFVGSEGTLGVITELTLRLYGRPEAVRAAVCPFESMAGAANTVIQTIQLGIPVARIEIIDEAQLARRQRATRRPTIRWRRRCSSSSTASARSRSRIRSAPSRRSPREHGAKGFKWASSLEERTTLWQARHNAYYATVASRPGARAWTTDVCVPISHLAECILETQDDLQDAERRRAARRPCRRRQLPSDLHARPRRSEEFDTVTRQRAAGRARAEVRRHLQRRARRRLRQAEVPAQEHGESLDVMRAIKRALDPDNLMNPGKLIPEV